jgi:hypothetical protein
MIVRAILIAIGLCAFVYGLLMVRFLGIGALPPIIAGVVLLLGTLFEGRYRPRVRGTASDWQATGERFVDPGSGKLVDVYYDPKTGERQYRNVD